MRVFLVGYMGSGKTTLAKPLADALGIPHFDLDMMIEKGRGVTVTEIFDQEGEDVFRQLESEYLLKLLNSEESFVLATGGGTPCFNGNMTLMNEQGVTLFLDEKPEVILQRLYRNTNILPFRLQLPAFFKQTQ